MLALSVLPGLRRPQGIRALLAFQAIAALDVIGLGAVGMAVPSVVPPVPEPATRPALTAEIGLLREEPGTAFDARCVGALEAVLRREQPQPRLATLRLAAASG